MVSPSEIPVIELLGDVDAESQPVDSATTVDWTNYSRDMNDDQLEVLEAAGHVECIHEGPRLFELVDDPREQE